MKPYCYSVKNISISLIFLIAISGCMQVQQSKEFYLSYAEANFGDDSIDIILPTGSSAIDNLTLTGRGDIDFTKGEDGWAMGNTDVDPITFKMNLKAPTMVQVAVSVDFQGIPASASYFDLNVNGEPFDFYVKEDVAYDTTYVVIQIPETFTRYGENILEFSEDITGDERPLIEFIRFLPQKIIAENGVLNTTLFTQFGQTRLMQGENPSKTPIWTRSYGLSETTEMLPGPILYYKPGDLVNVELVNLLNPDESPALRDFDSLQRKLALQDEILSGHEVKGDLNIPHDLKFTNLHVHGLHVDPDRDNVLLVIEPNGIDMPMHSNAMTKDTAMYIDKQWLYEYQIPKVHLPGTHWYHPHKHGSTSAQLENGLAGTMVIMENEDNAIVPFPGQTESVEGNGGTQTDYDLDKWRAVNDRVMAIQEVSNYGLQAGDGSGINTIKQATGRPSPLGVSVNGIDELQIETKAGQLERWRLVNAGTNHRAYSHIWMGRYTGRTIPGKDEEDQPIELSVFQSVDIHLVAVDGITLSEKVVVNALHPASMAPGNRSDFLVQMDEPGQYVLFKNYRPVEPFALQNAQGEIIFRSDKPNDPVFWPDVASAKNNTFVFKQEGITEDNYLGFSRDWEKKGSKRNFTPLIKVKPKVTDSGQFLDVNFATASQFTKGALGQWMPANANFGRRTESKLVWLTVKDEKVGPNESPLIPTDAYLSKIAPNTAKEPPGYVARFDDEDILQSRPVVFDVSGIRVNVKTETRGSANTIDVPQFTLNGRFFNANDTLGTPLANGYIQTGYKDPSDLDAQVSDSVSLTFNQRPSARWDNRVGDRWFFTNPGYYQPLATKDNVYSFDSTGTMPSWQALTGIPDVNSQPQPAIVNQEAKKYELNEGLIPGLPLAKTGEEWVLINNSDVSHPFHIHINPFFVTEVGQLSYEEYTDANNKTQRDWFMRSVTAEQVSSWAQRPEMPKTGAVPGTVYQGNISAGAIVGNWWDTLTIPAHGYVKVRYWLNVPQQLKEEGGFIVNENVNREGLWVYHCHILRHEDRGMMMLVGTEKSNEDN